MNSDQSGVDSDRSGMDSDRSDLNSDRSGMDLYHFGVNSDRSDLDSDCAGVGSDGSVADSHYADGDLPYSDVARIALTRILRAGIWSYIALCRHGIEACCSREELGLGYFVSQSG